MSCTTCTASLFHREAGRLLFKGNDIKSASAGALDEQTLTYWNPWPALRSDLALEWSLNIICFREARNVARISACDTAD